MIPNLESKNQRGFDLALLPYRNFTTQDHLKILSLLLSKIVYKKPRLDLNIFSYRVSYIINSILSIAEGLINLYDASFVDASAVLWRNMGTDMKFFIIHIFIYNNPSTTR